MENIPTTLLKAYPYLRFMLGIKTLKIQFKDTLVDIDYAEQVKTYAYYCELTATFANSLDAENARALIEHDNKLIEVNYYVELGSDTAVVIWNDARRTSKKRKKFYKGNY